MKLHGFISPEARAAFEAGRTATLMGMPTRAICGAKGRNGPCRDIPVQGHNRCQRHLGPHAARALWARREAEYHAGEIPDDVYARMLRRRAVNQQRVAWRRDPWAPGSTIDLADRQQAFETALRVRGYDAARLAPAVLDWAAWQYRRSHIDADKPALWAVAMLKLPARIEGAGPCPGTRPPAVESETPVAVPVQKWRAARPKAGSKRLRESARRPVNKLARAATALSQSGANESAGAADGPDGDFFIRHRQVLSHYMPLCPDDGVRAMLVRALVLADQGDPIPWHRVVAAL